MMIFLWIFNYYKSRIKRSWSKLDNPRESEEESDEENDDVIFYLFFKKRRKKKLIKKKNKLKLSANSTMDVADFQEKWESIKTL